MAKTITLTKGYRAKVSDADYAAVSRYKWRARVQAKPNAPIVYAYTKLENGRTVYLHRFIMALRGVKLARGRVVDHRDRTTLNNQKRNLRVSTVAENNRNRTRY